MKKMTALLAGAALMLAASSAMATVVNLNSGEPNMQQILNNITLGGLSSVDAANDFIKDPNDSLWTTGGTSISSATMIIELAGNANINSFGIYDSTNLANTAELFSGPAGAGSRVALTFGDFGNFNLRVSDFFNPATSYKFNSSVFGFYFKSGLNTFYSDTSQNTDGYDHMVAYAAPSPTDQVKLPGSLGFTPWLANEYILGFEDIYGGGDHDYNDMVLMVESVAPVPEPGTMMLLGAGFLGLAIYGKRRKNA